MALKDHDFLPYNQRFTLPLPIIYLVANNIPIYNKLSQTCKYFYASQRAVVIKDISLYFNTTRQYTYAADSNEIVGSNHRSNLSEIKIWLAGSLMCHFGQREKVLTLLTKVDRFHIDKFSIFVERVFQSFFKTLSGTITELALDTAAIEFDNSTQPLTVCNILAMTPKLTKFK